MKLIGKSMVLLLAVALMTGLVLNFNGCTTNSPMTPGAENLASRDGLNMVQIGSGSLSLNKGIITVSELITPEKGGELVLKLGASDFDENSGGDSDDGEDDIEIVDHRKKIGLTIKLKVKPGSVDIPTTIYLRLDPEYLDMDFGPDGTVFNTPAKLSIDAKGLDFSNISSEILNVYYNNPETGQWETVERESVVISKRSGDFKINNARIPHFSRYAVGWGDL